MATLAIQSSSSAKPNGEKTWSFKALLDDVKRYLWRYGTATDVETDPIELLQQATKALEEQEELFEKEVEDDIKRLGELERENAQLKVELAAVKAKLPPWWKG